MLWSFFPLLVRLSDEDKRMIYTLIIVILVLIALIGLIARGLVKYMRFKGREVDNYTHDLVTYGVFTKPRQFRRYVYQREFKTFTRSNFVPILIMAIAAVGVYLYLDLVAQQPVEVVLRAIDGLWFSVIWPEPEPFFGIVIPNDWPEVFAHFPEYANGIFTFRDIGDGVQVTLPLLDAIVIYAGFFTTVIAYIFFMGSTLTYFGRIGRGWKASTMVFQKHLENATPPAK